MEFNQFGKENVNSVVFFGYEPISNIAFLHPLDNFRKPERCKIGRLGLKEVNLADFKFPIGKTCECHMSDEEYTEKISASFFINCFVKLRLN